MKSNITHSNWFIGTILVACVILGLFIGYLITTFIFHI